MVSPESIEVQRKSSNNIGISRLAIRDAAKTVMGANKRVLEINGFTGDPAPLSTDCLTSQDAFSAADREPEIGSIRPNDDQLGLNPIRATEANRMLQSESPIQDNF